MAPGLFNCAKRNKTLKYFLTHRRCITTIKADQINILRKQYDAFLEEDKKRKERNECILEKLDQIRLSNTVARYKSNVYFDHRVSFNCNAEAPTSTTCAHPQTNNDAKQLSSVNYIRKYKEALIPTDVDILTKPVDERYLINEISKKYILIPKLRSFVSEDYIPREIKHDNNNDNDWKSKYSILDKLKQNEKEEVGFSALNNRNENFLDHIPSREPKYRNIDKELDVEKDKDDMYFKQYAPKPQTNMPYLKDEGHTKLNHIVDAKTEETNETERRSDPSSKLGPNISRGLKLDAEVIKNTDNNLEGVAGEQQRLQSDRSMVVSRITIPENTYSVQNVHEDDPALFKNTDDHHNDPIYNDKHENEANEKVTPVVDDNVHVQHFTPAEDVTLADGVNITSDGYAGQQTYLAPSDQYVSEPAATSEQVYLTGDQSLRDQYVSEETASAEQAYLPVADQTPGSDRYLSEPACVEQAYMPEDDQTPGSDQYVSEPACVEQSYLPGADDVPDGNQQYISEPMVSEEQTYLSEDNIQTGRGDQYVSEPVTVAAEKKDISENEEQQITNETHDPTMDDTVTSEIAEYEAEQNQMFYSEQINYQNYNQTGVGDAYDPENTGYDPALYYQQQEPVEINEHEETSQRYDPSFEQQYAVSGEEQQQYVDQQLYGEHYDEQQYAEQQQYGEHYPEEQYGEQLQTELGGTTHVYDQVPGDVVPEQQIIEQVQQGLDKEDFNVLNQTGGVGDVVEESAVYMQNPDVAPTEPPPQCQETPENVS